MTGTELQARLLGRRCALCDHPDREAIEQDALSGSLSIRGITRQWELSSPEGLRRHLRNHLDGAAQDAVVAVKGVPALDVLVRLLDLAADAHDFRTHLEETGNDRLVSQAFRAEAATIGFLIDRLGITKLPTHDLDRTMRASLAEAQGVLRVVGRIAKLHPRVGEVLADEFEQLDLPELATKIREQANKGRTLILETSKGEAS